jgi:hypothetical protein
MSDSDQHDAVRNADEQVDAYVRRIFGLERAEDRSGLFGGQPTSTPGEPDKDALFEAYMRRYFPGQHG